MSRGPKSPKRAERTKNTRFRGFAGKCLLLQKSLLLLQKSELEELRGGKQGVQFVSCDTRGPANIEGRVEYTMAASRVEPERDREKEKASVEIYRRQAVSA